MNRRLNQSAEVFKRIEPLFAWAVIVREELLFAVYTERPIDELSLRTLSSFIRIEPNERALMLYDDSLRFVVKLIEPFTVLKSVSPSNEPDSLMEPFTVEPVAFPQVIGSAVTEPFTVFMLSCAAMVSCTEMLPFMLETDRLSTLRSYMDILPFTQWKFMASKSFSGSVSLNVLPFTLPKLKFQKRPVETFSST